MGTYQIGDLPPGHKALGFFWARGDPSKIHIEIKKGVSCFMNELVEISSVCGGHLTPPLNKICESTKDDTLHVRCPLFLFKGIPATHSLK
jgi:hypothetical protein